MTRLWTTDPYEAERCAEGYVQGIGCAKCERESRRLVARLVAILVVLLVVLPILLWVIDQ